MGDDDSDKKILLLPLKMYTKPLPKRFIKLIDYYKSMKWYYLENFYLITDGKNILGYLGLNINEEDAPYGKYVFIYALNLDKSYQNRSNIKYIINFVQSIARQSKCYSIDVLFENSNFTYEQLKELGFLVFTSIDMVKINNKTSGEVDINLLKRNQSDINDLDKFVPICKKEPLKSLFSRWKSRKDNIEIYRNIYNEEDEKIEFISIKENKSFNNVKYNHFTLLVDSKYLYDDNYINKAISILKLIISKEDSNFIVSLPAHLNKITSIYNEENIIYSLNILRKNNV